MIRLLVAVLAGLCLTAPAKAQDGGDSVAGKALVEANCAPCHGVGAADKSPHPDAPELRTLNGKYRLEDLEEAFAEGIWTGHPDMPEFRATPTQIADMIAYIGSLDAP